MKTFSEKDKNYSNKILRLQVYPDGSKSKSFIKYDSDSLKVIKVHYDESEPNLKLSYKPGDTLSKSWLDNFTAN